MLHDWFSAWLREIGGEPCFRIYGRGRRERAWRVIDVFATSRRDRTSRWPLWRGVCITWTDSVIAVGWDFAEQFIREQSAFPVSREHPLLLHGRFRDGRGIPSNSEIMAHEIGHTWQARRLGGFYWPFVGTLTLFREGPNWWNHFENEASAEGVLGGIVAGSVCADLQHLLVNSRA